MPQFLFIVLAYALCYWPSASLAALNAEITQFYGLVFDEGITLHWITASERGTTDFRIERSHDGQTFRPLGFVGAGVPSGLPGRYSFTDSYPFPGDNYYRLLAEGPGGEISDSSTIRLYAYNTYTAGIRVFPNPFQEDFMVQLPRSISPDAVLLLVSLQGNRLFQWEPPLGQRMTLLQAPGLAAGSYILFLQDGRRRWSALINRSGMP